LADASGGGGASAINDLSDAVTYNSGFSIGLGTGALANDDSTDNDNTALGYNALNANTSGQGNVAVGHEAGDSITTGQYNTLLGIRAGTGLTTGQQNTLIGRNAGESRTTGQKNTALGHRALLSGNNSEETAIGFSCFSERSGHTNAVGLGCQAGQWNEGDNNTAIGYQSCGAYSTSAGNNNVGVGYRALRKVSTGNDNTTLGNQAGEEITTGSNNTVIGNSAAASSATVSNEITLGNASVTSLRIPGLQSGASDGQVLTYSSSNGNITLADAGGSGMSRAQSTAIALVFG
jgi:hypothetical protein